jgi:toxin CptA
VFAHYVAMSIAVSAVIIPSRLLRRALLCFAAANLAVAAAVGAGLARPFWQPQAGAGCCALAGMLMLWSLAPAPKVRGIDISGLGQLRLTVQQDIGGRGAPTALLRLLPGSTLWPGLMLLRLGGDDGTVWRLALLSDSVEAGQFRRLSVAIRDIAVQKKQIFGNQ